MGQEIFYCSGCQSQLRSADFEKGKAYKILALEAICSKCVPEALKSLPPDKLQALQRALGGPPASSQTPKSGTGRVPLATSTPKSGTGRIPLAASPSSTRRIPVMPDEKGKKAWLLFVIVAGLALVGGIAVLGSRKPVEPVDRTGAAPAPADTPIPLPMPPADSARDGAARESLKKAHLYADAHAKDYLEQVKLFEAAALDAKGTGFEIDAAKALEGARRRAGEAASAELKVLDDLSREACTKEEFKRASALVEEARRKPLSPDWSSEIDRRLQEVQSRIDQAYAKLRAQALAAKPDSAELRSLKERLAKWGEERLTADLDRALAEASAPKPTPAPSPAPTPAPTPPDVPKVPPAAEAEAYGRSWSTSLALACGREFPAAIQELERILPTLQDPAQKSQATGDLDAIRAVAALHAEAFQALSKYPVGKKITLGFIDYDNNPQKVEGPFVRVNNGTITIGKGRPLPQWPLGHLTIRSLLEYAPSRTKITAATACLIEGDLQGAKDYAGENNPAIAARFWKWAAEAAKPSDEATQKKEGDARYTYYFALMNAGAPGVRADAAMKCRKLLEESGSLTWVRRNRAMLAAVADTTREFVAGPAALRQVGMFRLEVPKTLPYWMCSIDIDPAKRRDNYVEMDFSALCDSPYRAWAYVGACCSESLVFYSQTTDQAGAEPGGDPGEPVKHTLTSATKNHAGHAGRKGPSRWGWVEIPLPKYEKPGPKVLRLLTATQGFSVSLVVVSSLRDKAPSDAELKEWEKDIVHNPGPVGPTIGLAAWFKADAGTVVEAGKLAQWQDQSGHGRNAIQVTPAARPVVAANTLNGKPVVRFDGTANVLSFDCPVNGLPSLTLFMVAAATKNQRGNELGNYATLEWPEFGPWGNIFLGPQQTCVAYRFGTGQFGNMAVWERPPGAPQGWTVTSLRKDGPKEELFVQGALALTNKDKYPAIAHTQDVATIGAGSDSRQNPLKFYPGDVAEILVFTRCLSEFERDALERYLRAKYGL